jgi:tRNA G18 (ribose-2'-O)-methylase SpoU
MPRISITDIDDPRIAVYRDLNRSSPSREPGLFIAEGHLLVGRLLASSVRVLSILCTDHGAGQLPDRVLEGLPVFVVPTAAIHRVVGFRFHRGMLACGRRAPSASLESLAARKRPRGTLVVCPWIADPTNLGGIVRNCCAFGADGLILGPSCADPFSRRVVRVSMGTVLRLPIRESCDVAADLTALRDIWHYELVATVLEPSAESLPGVTRRCKTALLFGNEGHGLAAPWREMADRQVTLAMQRDTDSLNVATSTAVFLYHYTSVASVDDD